jgi:hypothetical protein
MVGENDTSTVSAALLVPLLLLLLVLGLVRLLVVVFTASLDVTRSTTFALFSCSIE